MATRHIKRLQQQLNAAKAEDVASQAAAEEKNEVESSSEEEDGGGAVPAKPFNPFALLTDDDEDSDGPDSRSEEEDGEEEQEAAPAAAAAKQAKPAAPQQPQKQKQQQPKQPASSGKQQQQSKQQQQQQQSKQKQPSGAKAAAASKTTKATKQTAAGAAAEDDIDKLLRELDMAPAASPAAAAAAAAAAGGGGGGGAQLQQQQRLSLPPLLGIDPKRIRGDEELRRIFGAGVIEAVDRQEGGASGRRGGAASSAAAAVRRRQLKKFMLVTPADHWPHVDSGISMKAAGTTPDGSQLFCYTWSPNYAAAQRVFEAAQASYDPNAVGAVLAQFPYHVDSLLAMNELYRSMGEAQTADDFLCRALFALEGAWCHGFDPTTANVRLDIEVAANRGLFLALFRHAQSLSRRGCHSSALEVTKLLLGLDPEDPVGGLLLLDYLALRAGAFAYLERFVAEFDSSHSLALLPNYAFALPMARFRLEQQQQQQQQQGSGSSGSTKKQAQQRPQQQQGGGGGGVSSLTLLAQALLLHPLVLPELLGKLQGQGAAREEVWQELAKRRLYAKASDHGSTSLGHLIGLFVERSHQLWKPADVLAWLRVAATAAADVADGRPRTPSSSAAAAAAAAGGAASSVTSPDDVIVEGSAEDWACVARESFPAAARNEYGHLRVGDFSDAVNALPQEEMQAVLRPGGAGGRPMDQAAAVEVLNDMLEQEQLAAAMAAVQQQQAAGGPPPMPAEALQAANPLLMLLESLLPWVNAGQQPDYADGEGGGGGGAGAGAGGGGGGGQPPPAP